MAIEPQVVLEILQHEYQDQKGTLRRLTPDARLAEDLGIDSLLAQELLIAVEERFDVELLGNPALARVGTVAELVDTICRAARWEPVES